MRGARRRRRAAQARPAALAAVGAGRHRRPADPLRRANSAGPGSRRPGPMQPRSFARNAAGRARLLAFERRPFRGTRSPVAGGPCRPGPSPGPGRRVLSSRPTRTVKLGAARRAAGQAWAAGSSCQAIGPGGQAAEKTCVPYFTETLLPQPSFICSTRLLCFFQSSSSVQ